MPWTTDEPGREACEHTHSRGAEQDAHYTYVESSLAHAETVPSSRVSNGYTVRPSHTALAPFGLHPGILVDRTYRVDRLLGSGGMGIVVLATDERLERKVAIKFIRPDLFPLPEMRALFHNEARAMAKIAHRNVLSVFACGEHAHNPYFVMEYIDGQTAETWLQRASQAGALSSISHALSIVEQACLGVEAIHASHTVHRDIKPSNLLIDRTFRVAVGDLGVAHGIERIPRDRALVGSASYMAPEAALGAATPPELVHRRDIYALGCTAYELLTGRPPFFGPTDVSVLAKHVLRQPPAPSQIRPDLSSGFDSVILRALSKDPRLRFATVEEFRRSLVAESEQLHEPARILVADDDSEWRNLFVIALHDRFPHAQIDTARDGGEALRAITGATYAVMVVDLQMPNINGVQLVQRVRANERLKSMPIVVVTAAGGSEHWRQLATLGVDTILVKPVHPDDLERVLRRALRAHHDGTQCPSTATLARN